MNTINYRNIADAIDFYNTKGFTYIETPWYVTDEVMAITRPEGMTNENDYYIKRNDKYLVASGEQSFIYLLFKGQLPPGYYQTVTPCYRFESIDSIHRKCFMKNELIYVIGDNDNSKCIENKRLEILNTAKAFFETKLGNCLTTIQAPLDNSINNEDLMYQTIELGSYGIRNYKSFGRWIYGTGCAEPRLSQVQAMIKNICIK